MDFKNFIDWKSFIMGAAFASFICVVASQYQLDWLYAQVSMFVTLIAVLMVGALVGFVGAYTYRNRQRAIAAKEKQAKTGKNKKGKK